MAEATKSKRAVADECHAVENPASRYNTLQQSFAAHIANCACPTSPDAHCRSPHSLAASSLTRWTSYIKGCPPSKYRCLWSWDLETRMHSWGPKPPMQIAELRASRRDHGDRYGERTFSVDLSHRRFEMHLSCRSHEEGSANIWRELEHVCLHCCFNGPTNDS